MPRRTFGRMIALCLASTALVATGCGAKEAGVAKTAFEQDIDSANVSMAIAVKAAGNDVGVSLGGPYKSNGDDALPSVDWRLNVRGMGPVPIEGRVISSAENAWVQYEGETYEVGADKVAELKEQGGKSGQSPADLRAFMQQAKDWFPESSTEEDAELDGEEVTRVTGTLDLAKALPDLQGLAQQPGLPQGQLEQLERFMSDPRFTLDVAKSDGSLRRIVAEMDLEGVPGGGRITFTLQLKEVGEPVTIATPSGGRPIEELGEKLKAVLSGTTA